MYGENPIGKKVNLLLDYGFCSRKMSDEVYEVVRVVPWSKELNDWCEHYIVKGADGVEKEIRMVDCVFSPNNDKDEDSRVFHFLDDNGVYAEVWNHYGTSAIVVSISWGDWKHEHLWARDLMSFLGYTEIGSKVTEEDGSDTYSAEHYFLKTA